MSEADVGSTQATAGQRLREKAVQEHRDALVAWTRDRNDVFAWGALAADIDLWLQSGWEAEVEANGAGDHRHLLSMERNLKAAVASALGQDYAALFEKPAAEVAETARLWTVRVGSTASRFVGFSCLCFIAVLGCAKAGLSAVETGRTFFGQEYAITFVPAPRVEGTHAEVAPAASSERHLNGAALHKSVFPTWIALVVFSWVSLLWGTLVTVPIGIGFGMAASLVMSVFLFPLWASVFGFLGMGMARSSTMAGLNFKQLPDDHSLSDVNKRYSAALSMPPPRLGTINVFNAIAMGENRHNATVAVGEPLLEKLLPEEVDAVLGHELGHVASGDMRRMMLMRTFQNAMVWFGLAHGIKQLMRFVLCLFTELWILAFSRKREFWADAIGAALAGKDAMIGALQKLEQGPPLTSSESSHARFMFRGKAEALFSTHPSTRERIEALESELYLARLPYTGRVEPLPTRAKGSAPRVVSSPTPAMAAKVTNDSHGSLPVKATTFELYVYRGWRAYKIGLAGAALGVVMAGWSWTNWTHVPVDTLLNIENLLIVLMVAALGANAYPLCKLFQDAFAQWKARGWRQRVAIAVEHRAPRC